MDTTDASLLFEGLEMHDRLAFEVDSTTLQILDRRRRTSVVKRRGWLISQIGRAHV